MKTAEKARVTRVKNQILKACERVIARGYKIRNHGFVQWDDPGAPRGERKLSCMCPITAVVSDSGVDVSTHELGWTPIAKNILKISESEIWGIISGIDSEGGAESGMPWVRAGFEIRDKLKLLEGR